MWLFVAATSIAWNMWNERSWLLMLNADDVTNLMTVTIEDVAFAPLATLAIGGLLGGALIALAVVADYALLCVGRARMKLTRFHVRL